MSLRSLNLDLSEGFFRYVSPSQASPGRPPLKVDSPLDQEFTESIQEPELLDRLLDPEERSHLVDLQEYVLASRRDDHVKAAESQA